MGVALRKKGWLPNNAGFIFYAVFPSGEIKQDVVYLSEKGTYTCTYFKEMIGWVHANYELK